VSSPTWQVLAPPQSPRSPTSPRPLTSLAISPPPLLLSFPNSLTPSAAIPTTIAGTMSSEPVTVDALPPELLCHIFSYLDAAPPSETRLHDQPKTDMLSDSETPLKNISHVSKRWRDIVLPALFRHAVWEYDRWDLMLVEPGQNLNPVTALPFLHFIHENNLGRYVDSLTMIVKNSMGAMTRRAEFGMGLDPLEPSDSSANNRVSDAKTELLRSGTRFPQIQNRAATYNEDNNWLWELLFSLMDPRTITLIASPQMLASLLSRMLFLGDAWSFSRDLIHILSLSRESKSSNVHLPPAPTSPDPPGQPSSSSTASRPPPVTADNPSCTHSRKPSPPSSLFTIRPWTHLLLNEGSSTRVYKTYEFFLRRPPSILGALLGCEEHPNDTPLIPPTLISFAYVAIFPLSSHFNTLVAFLPRIERLFVQLVPRNDILLDPSEMRNVQSSDLWMERNSCYGLIMRELLVDFTAGHNEDDNSDADSDNNTEEPNGQPTPHSNWRYLKVFESGDAADREAWDMAVQYVRMSQTEWTVERDGVFVRGPRPTGSNDDGNQSGSDGSDDDSDAAASVAATAGTETGDTALDILSVPPDTFSPW